MSLINSFKGKFALDLHGRADFGKFLMTTGPFYAKCLKNAELKIGNRCFFNHNCSITCAEKIEIGDNCLFANNIVIVDHDHKINEKGFVKGELTASPVKIDDGVWCGSNSVILRGVHIGEGAVIAAGAVVKKDIPPFEMWGGVPAHCLKKLR